MEHLNKAKELVLKHKKKLLIVLAVVVVVVMVLNGNDVHSPLN